MREQLVLSLNDRYLDERDFHRIVGGMASAAKDIGRKRIESELEIPHSTLTQQLRDVNRHEPKVRLLLYMLRRRPDGELPKLLAAVSGHDVAPKTALTKEQCWDRVDEFCKRNPKQGEVLLRLFGLVPEGA